MAIQSKISEQLRAVIRAAPISRHRLAKETGLTEAALSRFVNGKGGLSLASIDRLGLFLGLKFQVQEDVMNNS